MIEFFAHYGEVAKACHVYDVGKALESARKLEQIERQRDEIEAYDGRSGSSYAGRNLGSVLNFIEQSSRNAIPFKVANIPL